MKPISEHDVATLSQVQRILEEAWREQQRSPFVQLRLGVAPTRLPDVSFDEARRRSAVGRALLGELDSIDV